MHYLKGQINLLQFVTESARNVNATTSHCHYYRYYCKRHDYQNGRLNFRVAFRVLLIGQFEKSFDGNRGLSFHVRNLSYFFMYETEHMRHDDSLNWHKASESTFL